MTVLVRARHPEFGFNRRDVAGRQLEPQLQDFLSRHAFHVSSGFTPEVGIVIRGSTAYVLPYQQAREECAEAPFRLVFERNVGMLEIFNFCVELLENFAQPLDRRIGLPTVQRPRAEKPTVDLPSVEVSGIAVATPYVLASMPALPHFRRRSGCDDEAIAYRGGIASFLISDAFGAPSGLLLAPGLPARAASPGSTAPIVACASSMYRGHVRAPASRFLSKRLP